MPSLTLAARLQRVLSWLLGRAPEKLRANEYHPTTNPLAVASEK
jgi:hypothetical protein